MRYGLLVSGRTLVNVLFAVGVGDRTVRCATARPVTLLESPRALLPPPPLVRGIPGDIKETATFSQQEDLSQSVSRS